jgi:deferrochelatase/peroxidase EfeB
VLLGAGVGLTAVSLGVAASSTAAAVPGDQEPFYGAHQAGIVTKPQRALVFGAFDIAGARRADLRQILQQWTAMARRMTHGLPAGPIDRPSRMPPADSGDAVGLSAARLTFTVALGATAFDRLDAVRLRPAALAPIPSFPADRIEEARSGGDLGVQVCADDPAVAFHGLRMLAEHASPLLRLRWVQQGFLPDPAGGADTTPRNLLGFKDGTRNLDAASATDMDDYVWVSTDTDQPWLRGGSFLVTRRIRVRLSRWDGSALREQQRVFGRTKVVGAPLGGSHEHDRPDFHARTANGDLVIPRDAHIRLAAPENNAGRALLRRGYSYVDGYDASGVDAGLFFMAYQRDPRLAFVPIYGKLARHDALNEYVTHTASAVFAVLPGVADERDWYGRTLFDAV